MWRVHCEGDPRNLATAENAYHATAKIAEEISGRI
jgi:hypothetical protein